MINITTKDGTQLSGEVKDLVILLENDGKKFLIIFSQWDNKQLFVGM